ncbi:MAG: M23 family metallopeptidase [Zoogloeaceae bacterium]|jgi:murein DD-endopeptidase MepM/ murein hydrolase activator NlpD|nr:M23 family metallopeptidase [Zoogloeaceae bacterium]
MTKTNILNQLRQIPERWRHPHWLLAGIGALSALGMLAVATPSAPQLPEQQTDVLEQLEVIAQPLALTGEVFLREERVTRGDTLDTLLSRLGVADSEARRYLISTPATQSLHRQLVPGRVVSARTTEAGLLLSLHFPLNGGDSVLVVARQGSKLTTRELPRQYETRQEMKTGEIRYSLFGATDAVGIPDVIAVQMAEIFSGEIDFHRDLRKGDRFTLIYEMQYYRGYPVNSGRILSAEFTNGGKTWQAFYHEVDGKASYYDAKGHSLKKAFLRSPLEFSRVTSGFKMRFHPILKTWRAHKGVDYGAPSGTKIRATGDGVVSFAGQQNGYGNIVILTHNGSYQTAYAHMRNFAEGLKKGDRVSQGDIVGYVGQTGWATGPHLHYEFRVNGKAIDPLSLEVPISIPLDARQQVAFKARAGKQQELLDMLDASEPAAFE